MSLKDPDDDYDELVPQGNDFFGKLIGKAKPKVIFLIIGLILGLLIHYYLINPFIIADAQEVSKNCLNSKLILNKENECLYTLVSEPKLAGEKCGTNPALNPTPPQETPLLTTDSNTLMAPQKQETTDYSTFRLNYFTSAEIAYDKIEITGYKLKHEYLDTSKVSEKCANWIQQNPCWTSEDIMKKSITLKQSEMDSLYELINQYNYFDLNDYYGPMNDDGTKANVRCYAYELGISFKSKDKDTIFCDRPTPPESGPMPIAFRKVLERLQELTN